MGMQFGSGAMMGGRQMMQPGAFGFGGFGVLALIAFFVISAIIVAIVIWAIARKHGQSTVTGTPVAVQAASTEDTALAIARERLARGDIEPEQYTAIVAALGGQPLTTPTAG